jgi:hypothetical protein
MVMGFSGYAIAAAKAFIDKHTTANELERHIGEQYLGNGQWAALFVDDDFEELLDDDF